MVRPERFELPTSWFVVKRQERNLLILRATECGVERPVRRRAPSAAVAAVAAIIGWAKNKKRSAGDGSTDISEPQDAFLATGGAEVRWLQGVVGIPAARGCPAAEALVVRFARIRSCRKFRARFGHR